MAEGVLFQVLGQIIGWLGSSAAREIGSTWHVGNELDDLRNTLSMIRAVVVDAEEQQVHSHLVRNWLERLENAVYRTDDLLDEFSSTISRRSQCAPSSIREARRFFSSSNQVVSRWKMARRVRRERNALDKIAGYRRDFGLEAAAQPNEKLRLFMGSHRDSHSSVIEENIVGREEDKAAVLGLVLGPGGGRGSDNVAVVPVVGIGGLGKTALAQLVFNDERVEGRFDMKIWVWVSVEFDVRLLVEKIVGCATYVSPKGLDMEQLQRRLHESMSKKRCLLVLDDVWNESPQKWEGLRDLLAKSAEECRVVVTTRSEKVAELVGTVEPYRLEVLGLGESWSLFSKVALGGDPAGPEAVEVGKKIVGKCGGIPLAIRAVGGMLRSKHPESEWPPFVEKELLEISQNNKNVDEMLLVTLKLSYDHLPSYLKHCFAYCSLFPKGCTINVEMLVHLWMAQGFITDALLPSTEALEERGRECFMELLWRSFFQEVDRDSVSGDIKTCKMHDLMHDLASLVAGKKCAKLAGLNREEIERETRHMSFHFHLDSFRRVPTSWTLAKRVRSVLLPSQSINAIAEEFSKSFCDAVTLHFKYVRALELKKLGIKTVPDTIGELIHLRYLDLSVNWDLQLLPNSITKLVNLQTLKLNHCRLRELPRDIKKLVSLRHLGILENRLTQMPSRLCLLTELRTLSQFVLREEANNPPTAAELNELGRLNNLRGSLEIKNLRHGMDLNDVNFKDKSHLQSLHLHWGGGPDVGVVVDHGTSLEGLRSVVSNLKELKLENYKAVDFPFWMASSFPNLVKFELRNCANCQRVPQLDQFHNLRMLKLENLPNLKYISEASHGPQDAIAMPCLRNLELYYLPNLNGWSADPPTSDHMLSSFPRLSSLRVFNCPKMISMPLYPFVEELVLENTSWNSFQTTLASAQDHATLSRLRTLVLGRNEDLESLPSPLERLTSLKELHISHCPNLKRLSPSIRQLASLEILKIRNCEELDISNDGAVRWGSFQSLRVLSFDKLPKLTALPEELRRVATLHHLEISCCPNVTVIPDWIRDLTSLATLEIWECPDLTSLPEAISELTSLETLIIYDCPILSQRCRRGGEDWPKIAKIPVVDLW